MADGADAIDRILALELGADDYVSKALHSRELLARIRAVLRRRRPWPLGVDDDRQCILPAKALQSEQAPTTGEHAWFDNWHVDFRKRELRYCETELVTLTRTELNVLRVLLRNAGRTIDRRKALELVYGEDAEHERAVDVVISRLRRKLAHSGDEIIRTVRSRGYIFLPAVSWT